jgi:septum formation protein
MKLILASQSPRRKEILQEAGYIFEIIPANIDEKSIRHDDYHLLPLLIAKVKAQRVAESHTDAVIIAADQVVVWNNQLREKPQSKEQAAQWLTHYHQHPALVINGIYVINTTNGMHAQTAETGICEFAPIPQDIAHHIAQKGNMMDAAGGFKVADPDVAPYVRITSGTTLSFKGLPLPELEELLRDVGYKRT